MNKKTTVKPELCAEFNGGFVIGINLNAVFVNAKILKNANLYLQNGYLKSFLKIPLSDIGLPVLLLMTSLPPCQLLL